MLGSVASRLTSTYYGSNPDAINAVGGNESGTLATGNLPPYTPTGTIISTSTAILLQQDVYTLSPGPTTLYGQSGSTSANQTPTITSTFTGVAQGGTSTPVSKIQPTLTADYIIKALPDDLPSGPGVTSIQGMTGAIFCGVGFVCTAQTLSFALGSGADYLAGTSGKITEDGVIYQAETTTPYGTTTTFDFRTFINTKVTLTGDITTQTLVGVMAGKAGSIAYIQDGAGGHTTVWNPIFKFGGGVTPTLSTAAGAIDILSYDCRTTTFCTSSLLQDVK
jgi:microcystin-dependent protein